MPNSRKRICIVGPSQNFLSGITYYTFQLANSLSRKYDVSVILLRNLIPKFLFPGRKRIGHSLTDITLDDKINVFDGIDWYWFPMIFYFPRFLIENKPEIIIFQWWTSSVVHSYFLIIMCVRFLLKKTSLILLFHETQDPLEGSFFLLRFYSRIMGKLIFNQFDEFAAHSNSDLNLISKKFNIPKNNISIVNMGSYNHYKGKKGKMSNKKNFFTLLFFGLIRPYKGLDYLIDAFDSIPADKIRNFRLVIAGESWGNSILERKLKNSIYKNRISYINRYISDSEVDELFCSANVAIFPYTRASQSAAAHTAICYGVPIIVSRVGGLKESMTAYEGTIFIEPCNVDQLRDAILNSYNIRNKKFPDPHPWENTVASYEKIFKKVE